MTIFHPSIHPSIHSSPFKIKVLSVSHSMGVGSIRLCRTPALHASLSSGSMPAWPHSLASVFTHSDHVFRGLPFFLVPRYRGVKISSHTWNLKNLLVLIQDVAHCTWPYHLSCRQLRTDVISLMPSFCSSESECVLILSLMPQIQRIMAQSLRRAAARVPLVPIFRYHGA